LGLNAGKLGFGIRLSNFTDQNMEADDCISTKMHLWQTHSHNSSLISSK